jgi:hypothetical protein
MKSGKERKIERTGRRILSSYSMFTMDTFEIYHLCIWLPAASTMMGDQSEQLPTSFSHHSPKLSPRYPGLLAKFIALSSPFCLFVLSTSISSLVVILALNLNNLSQPSSDRIVDTENCTCDCWDRAFKVREHCRSGFAVSNYSTCSGQLQPWRL